MVLPKVLPRPWTAAPHQVPAPPSFGLTVGVSVQQLLLQQPAGAGGLCSEVSQLAPDGALGPPLASLRVAQPVPPGAQAVHALPHARSQAARELVLAAVTQESSHTTPQRAGHGGHAAADGHHDRQAAQLCCRRHSGWRDASLLARILPREAPLLAVAVPASSGGQQRRR